MIAGVMSFLKANTGILFLFVGTMAGAGVLGSLAGVVPLMTSVDISQANSEWQIPNVDPANLDQLSDSLTIEGKWVIDPRTLRQRALQADRQNQDQEPSDGDVAQWTLLGLADEGDGPFAIIQVEGQNELTFGSAGDELPSGERIISLSDTSMLVQTENGSKQYRLFRRD